MSSDNHRESTLRVLVTGANSGLGFGICQRLIDDFLRTRSSSEQRLCIIITTRDDTKGRDTVARLAEYLGRAEGATSTARRQSGGRITFQQEILDLTSILSVQRLGRKLAQSTPSIDRLVLNAGISGVTHIKWFTAIWAILTDWRHAVTFPTFKGSSVGSIARPQTLPRSGQKAAEQPLGQVFMANVFGHYLLAHYLTPLLARSRHGHGRIIWLSSIEAYAHSLKPGDFQGLTHDYCYESSKRLTDILVLSAALPGPARLVHDYLSDENGVTPPLLSDRIQEPRLYVAQPGICATSIVPLPWILSQLMALAFYVARWLGSIWHTCTAYKGACAPVWLALADQKELDAAEQQNGRQKHGSATDFWGNEHVEATEVEGWGYGGTVSPIPKSKRGRWRYARDLTPDARQHFERLGADCWREMERLRIEWEQQLADVGNGI